MQCYTELIPPSGVVAAISLPFTSAEASNLILARTSLLQIFSYRKVNNGQGSKLVFVSEYSLSGTITSLGRVKTLNSRSGGEAVLVAFRDAKLSLIEWNAEQHSISTISIHYYETEDLRSCPWDPDMRECASHLTIDPSSRCAAFNFGVSKLAIIPFHQTGDDLVMDDFEDGDGSAEILSKEANGDFLSYPTPYAASFVLNLPGLDPGLLHPVHLAFMFGFREPTMGFLYSTTSRTATALAYERRDVTKYSTFALEMDGKKGTVLHTVTGLPNDLFKIVALPPPVGGALLVGGNELIHVDTNVKTVAIGINDFAKQASAFPMTDQSDLGMRLEGCQIESLGNANGDMILILRTGEIALLSFRMDGRNVSSLTLRIAEDNNTNLIKGQPSCIATFEDGVLFIGSERTDCLLLTTAKKTSQVKKFGSRATLRSGFSSDEEAEDEENDDDDDDDLYEDAGPDMPALQPGDVPAAATNSFQILDRLPTNAPIEDVAFGRPNKRRRMVETIVPRLAGPNLELVVASGDGLAGGVTKLSRAIDPRIIKSEHFAGINGIWSFPAMSRPAMTTDKPGEVRHSYFIVSKNEMIGEEESALYVVSDREFREKEGTEFDKAGVTISVGPIAGGSHIVQVLEAEIKVYDADFGLAQIWPFAGDDDNAAEAKAVSASFADPYVIILKDDSSVLLMKADKSGELDEVNLPSTMVKERFSSAVLYLDEHDFFDTSRYYNPSSATGLAGHILAFLSADGTLGMFSLPDLTIHIFSCEGLSFLPTLLAKDMPLPRHWKNADTLSDILIANLGDESDMTPHLIVRTSTDDIVLYEPFPFPGSVGSFRFRKVNTKRVLRAPSEAADEAWAAATQRRNSPLRALSDIGRFNAVFVPGASPALILKQTSSPPRIHSLRCKSVKALDKCYTVAGAGDHIFIDDENNLHLAQLPADVDFGQSDWVAQKVEVGERVACLTYFDRKQSYILATSQSIDFRLPQDDEWHTEWRDEQCPFLPQVEQGSLKLLSSESWKVIGDYDLEFAERAMCIKTLNLEVSEETHERKDLIVVGTAITKGENVTVRGHIYIFDVVDVVPDPDVPETDLRLKLIAKEEVKGAVTSLSQIGSQGFILAAQGQKCMVRGLKEDLSILPVAFMDMRYCVSVAKELKGTGLCILGDAMSGLWFVAFSEEPYKMQLFGTDQLNLEVVAAELLPNGNDLFMIVSDGDGVLHVMQYDPEHPKSERGTKLLHRSTFNTGSFPTTMNLLPRTPVSSESVGAPMTTEPDPDQPTTAQHQIIVTTQEGGLSLITPLSEQTYRRLSALQNILISNLEHPCGLNPRAYRAVESDGIGGRGMVDGSIVRRWLDQSSQHKANMADKIGGTVWDISADLEFIGGEGLGFL